MKKAKYWGIIPIYFNPHDNEVIGRNWFYDHLVDFAVWFDFEFRDTFGPIVLEDDD